MKIAANFGLTAIFLFKQLGADLANKLRLFVKLTLNHNRNNEIRFKMKLYSNFFYSFVRINKNTAIKL